jgi:hypothetical protein
MYMKKRKGLALIVLPLLLGGWFDDPPSWARPDGGPIDPGVFQHERSVCATQAAVYAGREDFWLGSFSSGSTGTFQYAAIFFQGAHRLTSARDRAAAANGN